MFILRDDGELTHQNKRVVIKPCFPGKHLDKYLSVRDEDDNEVSFIDDLNTVSEAERAMILGLLSLNRKKLRVEKVLCVEEEVEIRVFEVQTSSGKTVFYTKLEDWPKQLSKTSYLITDIHEDEYYIDTAMLDKKSLKLLDGLIE